MHQRDAVAALGLVHEMRRDEDRHAVAPRQLAQQLPEHVAGGRIDAGGRFVEDQHFRPMQAGGGELQPLADAQRQAGRLLIGDLGEVEMRERFVRRARAISAAGTR